ncbi:dipeptide transporter permease DppB [Escherichia coli]|nr:dipeptide transporter permease DppB [Escherichia coli]
MLQFILRRLGLVIPTFIGITLLTFAFVHMIPGDPVMIMAGERGISPERHAQLLAELGLDKPMWQQYLHYIWGVMHGDLGISMKSRIPVWEEFVPRFPGHAGTWRLRDDFCYGSRYSGRRAGCG